MLIWLPLVVLLYNFVVNDEGSQGEFNTFYIYKIKFLI